MIRSFALRYPRLLKEAHVVALPLVLSLGAIFGFAAAHEQRMAVVAWVAGFALLCARTFSVEFQERTFVLLLSQPISRRGIYLEKLLTLATVLAVLGLAHQTIVSAVSSRPREFVELGSPVLLVGLLAGLLAIASASFWSSIARSTLGTFAFTLGTLWAAFPVATSVRIVPWEIAFSGIAVAIGIAGWKLHSRVDGLDQAGFRELPGSSASPASRSSFGTMRIRRGSWARNYFAKEMGLQRSTFLFFAVFAAFILVLEVLVLLDVVHASSGTTSVLLNSGNFLIVVLAAVVAGNASMNEEHAFGTAVLDRTTPLGPLRLFSGKYLTSLGVFLGLLMASLVLFAPTAVLGVHHPFFPGIQSAMETFTNRRDLQGLEWTPPVQLLGLFAVSFWVSTQTRTSVFAALISFPMYLALQSAGFLGWAILNDAPSLPIDARIWVWLLSLREGDSSARFMTNPGVQGVLVLSFACVVGVLARLSYSNFRIPQSAPRRMFFQFLAVILVAVAAGAAVGTVQGARDRLSRKEFGAGWLVSEQFHLAAIRLLKAETEENRHSLRTYSWDQILATGALAPHLGAKYSTVRPELEIRPILLNNRRAGRDGSGDLSWQYAARLKPMIEIDGNRFFATTVGVLTVFEAELNRTR